ncbi:MAG: DMT family transporter [Acidimicrobiales bacterium]
MFLTVALSLGAALFLAVGFVVQQHAAAEEPPGVRLSFRLLLHLVRRPLWLGGVAAQVSGQVLGAIALGSGALGLVEPVMAVNLLFALPLAASWNRRRIGRREWVGAAALLAGLAVFIAIGNPHGGHTAHLPWPNWVLSGGSILVLTGIVVTIGRRRPASQQATMLALGAGMLFGLQDALTQRAMAVLGHGFMAVVVGWPAFTLVAVAIFGMLLSQSAFEAAPLDASLPAMTALEPITGIAFGVGVYHESLNTNGGDLFGEIFGLAIAVVGVYLVASSPIVTALPAVSPPTDEAAADDPGALGAPRRTPRRRDRRAWEELAPWRQRRAKEDPRRG